MLAGWVGGEKPFNISIYLDGCKKQRPASRSSLLYLRGMQGGQTVRNSGILSILYVV